MRAYRYEAVDAQGRFKRGLTDAETERQVRDRLRSDGLFPTAIEAEGTAGDDAGAAPAVSRLPSGVLYERVMGN